MLSALEKLLLMGKQGVGALRTMTPEQIAKALAMKGVTGAQAAGRAIERNPGTAALGGGIGLGAGYMAGRPDEEDEEEIMRRLIREQGYGAGE